MNTKMSGITRAEVLAKKRDRYARAGKEHKGKIITELVELFGYHPKSAIRALRPRVGLAAPFVRGRPREYDPAKLLLPLKAIWLAALQPCGERLKACLPEWLPLTKRISTGSMPTCARHCWRPVARRWTGC